MTTTRGSDALSKVLLRDARVQRGRVEEALRCGNSMRFARVCVGHQPMLCGLQRSFAPTTRAPFPGACHACLSGISVSMHMLHICSGSGSYPHLCQHTGHTECTTVLQCTRWVPAGVPCVPLHEHAASAALL
jgi:hypothetical protein